MSDKPQVFSPAVDVSLCPLCQQSNACGNLLKNDACVNDTTSCWCQSAEIRFPAELLQKVPKNQRGLACICRSCAKNFSGDGS